MAPYGILQYNTYPPLSEVLKEMTTDELAEMTCEVKGCKASVTRATCTPHTKKLKKVHIHTYMHIPAHMQMQVVGF